MKRVLQLFRRGPTLVGRDLAGNKYFESAAVEEGARPRRTVQTGQGEMDTAMDIEIPVQWLAWLRGTRASPPTLAELEAEQVRLQQLRAKVAQLEAAEAQRKQALLSPKKTTATPQTQDSSRTTEHAATGQQYQPDAWQPGQ